MARWRLCLAGLLLLQACGLGRPAELAFLQEPADVIAVRDRPLVLHCRVEGEPPISVTWHKDGAALADDSGVAVLANGSLLIKRLQRPSSAGDYSCAAQNRDGRLLSRRARVRLATLSKFHMHPESMAVEEGGVARFQCLIQGVPEATIAWECNRTALPPDDQRFTLLPAGILQLTGVRRADVGAYRCVASNIASTRCSQEAQLDISVSAPRRYKEPVILSGPQNLTLTVHQTAVLECIATGHPRPIVSWSRLDGRSIGVEGVQVLGTGNLMISDVSVEHAGVYVCAANRPGTRVRRTAQGSLMVQAPPEFVQWPQSVAKPLGSSASFSCVAQGAPEPHLAWLRNGKTLRPGENVRTSHSNTTLLIQRLTAADEGIYQCIAENSAGTNQASARLSVGLAPALPSAPGGVRATALSTTSLQVSWQQPPPEVTDGIIGYVLHIRRAGEAESHELQEAVSKTTFQHVLTGLEPATTYCIRLRAYSPLGASKDSEPVLASTTGRQPSATYELKLQAVGGGGDGRSSVRVVRLEGGSQMLDPDPLCRCGPGADSSLAGVVVGAHIGTACILFCLLGLTLGCRSRRCRKGAQDSWTLPRAGAPASLGPQLGKAEPVEMIDLVAQSQPCPEVPLGEAPSECSPPPQSLG
ncbi:immunoglobulin superfamily DCC subclass member 3-like isoform X1 [Pelodiscus sinensis]|uniref:immunoglobulin superfamily DCC subclass member 3-like isoform X1 n=1 Tax=Pelodiscus sinensis TaxID=13735 RepID=UPI003F6D4293